MTLETRLNAVRALESRISLIKSYLSTLSENAKQPPSDSEVTLSHPTLREIHSLVSHLSLLAPQDQAAFTTEAIGQSNDVALVSLLGRLGQSVKSMRDIGKKSAVVQTSRQHSSTRKTQLGMAYGLGGGRQKGYSEEFLRGL